MRRDDIAGLVEGTSDAAFVVDGDSLVVAWNEPAHQLLGIPAADAIGQSCFSVVHGTDECGAVCSEHCAVQQATGRHHPVPNFDMQVQAVRGSQWCNVSVVMAKGDGAGTTYALHILRPVDVSKRLEVAVRDFVVAHTGLPASEAAALLVSGHAAAAEADLSEREVEILGLMAEGGTSRSVAGRLHISPTTVNNHVQHILRKLNAHTRLEAIHRAERAGLI